MKSVLIDLGDEGVVFEAKFKQTRAKRLLMDDDWVREVDDGCHDELDD